MYPASFKLNLKTSLCQSSIQKLSFSEAFFKVAAKYKNPVAPPTTVFLTLTGVHNIT
jgi:hypothetical protein